MQKHIREKRIRETGLFFTSCPHETTGRENPPNYLYSFYTWLSNP